MRKQIAVAKTNSLSMSLTQVMENSQEISFRVEQVRTESTNKTAKQASNKHKFHIDQLRSSQIDFFPKQKDSLQVKCDKNPFEKEKVKILIKKWEKANKKIRKTDEKVIEQIQKQGMQTLKNIKKTNMLSRQKSLAVLKSLDLDKN